MTTTLPRPSFAGLMTKPTSLGDPNSLMLYGKSNTGKTTTLGTLIKVPGFDRICVVDLENGTKVFVNDPEIKQAVEDGRIDIVPIDKRDPEAFLTLSAVLDELMSNDFGYDAIALDSLDVAQDVAIDWYMANTFSESGKQDSLAAWGKVAKWTADLMWDFQNKQHFMGVVIGHSAIDTEKKTGISMVKPKLSGSAKDNIDSIPDIVAYLWEETLEDDKSHVVFAFGKGGGNFITKSRYSTLLPDRLVDPDMPEIFKYIRNEKTAAKAA